MQLFKLLRGASLRAYPRGHGQPRTSRRWFFESNSRSGLAAAEATEVHTFPGSCGAGTDMRPNRRSPDIDTALKNTGFET
jgi:hypothetical protein